MKTSTPYLGNKKGACEENRGTIDCERTKELGMALPIGLWYWEVLINSYFSGQQNKKECKIDRILLTST